MEPRREQLAHARTAQPSRPCHRSDKPRSFRLLRWGIPALLAGVLTTASFTEAPARLPFSPCPFYNSTGLPCPACGLTRGFVAIGHGDFAAGLAWHPLAPALYVAAVIALVASIFGVGRQAPLAWGRRATQYGAALAALTLVAVWLWRLRHSPLEGPTPLVAHLLTHLLGN